MRDKLNGDRIIHLVPPNAGRRNAGRRSQYKSIGRRQRTGDWRLGGPTLRPWNLQLLLVSVMLGVAGVAGSVLISHYAGPLAPPISQAVLWIALSAIAGVALIQSRPAGLLRFRVHDVVWGLLLGLFLRATQGLISDANARPFPRSSMLMESEGIRWLLWEGVPFGVIGPVLEEFFFRAVILVSVFHLLRYSLGSLLAATAASMVSAGTFVLLHEAFSPMSLFDGLQLLLLGLTCAGLVFSTGRLSAAIITHVVYNCSYLGLVVVGS